MPLRRAALALAVAATAAIAVLLLIPLPLPPEGLGPPESDKVAHALLFGALAVSWGWALRPARGRGWLALALAVTAYGGALELLQALTPYRNADLADLAGDGLGAFAAVLVARLLRPR